MGQLSFQFMSRTPSVTNKQRMAIDAIADRTDKIAARHSLIRKRLGLKPQL